MFQNGLHIERGWKLVLRCSSEDLSWRRVHDSYNTDSGLRVADGDIVSEGDDPMMEELKLRRIGEEFDELKYPWPLCGK